MPLVFVHGVSNRIGPDYLAKEKNRESFFRQLTLPAIVKDTAKTTKITFPYWGDNAAIPHWDHACLPTAKEYEAFGTTQRNLSLLIPSDVDPLKDAVVLSIARHHSLMIAVDLIWAVVGRDGSVSGNEKLLIDTVRYCESHPNPDWLGDSALKTDLQLVQRLSEEVKADSQIEQFGSIDWSEIKESVERIAQGLGNIGSVALLALFREAVQEKASQFLGDAFYYFNNRRDAAGAPGPIPQCILESLRTAQKTRTETDPLIVIGHSMGGNIVYDLCTDFASNEDWHIDIFVTVGSQFSLFQELDLFEGAPVPKPVDMSITKMPKPLKITNWINVFDKNDVFGYSANRIFADVHRVW